MERCAVILAGGFGTRLRSVVSDVPKPMAPVNDRPFLAYLLDKLYANHFSHCVLSVGYMADVVKNAFGCEYRCIPIRYAQEETPLGTGGAIRFASSFLPESCSRFFVLNGDTFLDVDFDAMESCFEKNRAQVVLAVKKLDNCFRYGTLQTENSRILGFQAAGSSRSGVINGGIYLIDRNVFPLIADGPFSFENDFLEKKLKDCQFYSCETDGYFIDIGIPEDYARAQTELKQII